MGDEGMGKRPTETLGWLSQSAMPPKKRREIEGVGASSLFGLKAQVAKKQQEASDVRDGREDLETLRRRSKDGTIASLLERRNAGVGARDKKDRLEIKSSAHRLSDSQAALERKAELYERLASGHIADEEAEKYEVDFLLKGLKGQAMNTAESALLFSATGGMVAADMVQEQQRRAWEQQVYQTMRQETITEAAADDKRELIRQLEQETREGRDKAESMRRGRAAAESRKKERLKAAFLKRQLAKDMGKAN